MKIIEIRQTASHPDLVVEYAFEGADEIDLASFVANPHSASVTQSDGKDAKRWGIVSAARQEETTVNSTRYALEMHSWFHLLRDVPSCAVYQNMTVPEIVKAAAKALPPFQQAADKQRQ